ncbi:MAG: hypothetical protein KatS3mg095_0729 [Candidatus Parcubacteria bacterium]|nr:MAG: hypothetical protein KatS3mg095_0729 [Candidatus Parcubacteria bacterium]
MELKKKILVKNNNYQFKIVKINELKKEFLNLIKKEKPDFNKFQIYLKDIKIQKLSNFLFFLRILDFRLWEFPQNWQYKNKKGFYGLLLRIKDLFKFDLDKINFLIFKKIISPKEKDYLAKLRYKIFKQSLDWLHKNYESDFMNYFEENKKPIDFCFNLCQLEKFQDYYQNFYFLKPNQLLYLEFIIGNKIFKKFENELKTLTIFSDYKITQIFLNFNLIFLPQKYLEIIKSKKKIKKQSTLENELRWSSIILGENLSKKLNIPSYLIDNLMWNLAHKIKFKIPHPRVKTIFY